MVLKTAAGCEIGQRINLLITDIDEVIIKHTDRMNREKLPTKDGYYILTMALAERLAATIYMAEKVLDTTQEYLLNTTMESIKDILETAK